MPIIDGKYQAPTWVNNASPAMNASEMQAISNRLASVDTNAQLKPTNTEYTMVYTYWTSAKKYSYTNTAITATNTVKLLPGYGITTEELAALSAAKIVLASASEQIAGSIQLTALGTVPTISIPVIFQIG